MESNKHLYKNNPSEKVWWLDNPEELGVFVFTFDRKTFFNLFQDYPHKLTAEQRTIFDKENPYWAEFFKDRQ